MLAASLQQELGAAGIRNQPNRMSNADLGGNFCSELVQYNPKIKTTRSFFFQIHIILNICYIIQDIFKTGSELICTLVCPTFFFFPFEGEIMWITFHTESV
jgi:hypothetical protein